MSSGIIPWVRLGERERRSRKPAAARRERHTRYVPFYPFEVYIAERNFCITVIIDEIPYIHDHNVRASKYCRSIFNICAVKLYVSLIEINSLRGKNVKNSTVKL